MGLFDTIKKKILMRALKEKEFEYADDHATSVGQFYNKYNDKFVQVYGEVIQAFRTNNLDNILNYQIDQIGLEAEHKVLDAGCGVCGPASYFADKVGCDIEAVTISQVQVDAAKEKIKREGVEGKVNVQLGDYHKVDELFPRDHFDKVYFLESFGHSRDKGKLLKSVWKVLKPGGEVYIKDLFVRKIQYPILQKKIYQEIDKINEAYRYDVAELSELVDLARELGFVISFIKTIDIGLDDFENLAISNEWQELTGIAQIKDWNNYVFPVDFFEVKLYKLEYNQEKGKHRYFVQNLFQIRKNDVQEEDLGY